MKTLFSILAVGSLLITTASAQNNTADSKPSISIGVVESPIQPTGNLNYLLSLSDQDFKNKKYAFCTDSNATIAYITLNGNKLRLTGGLNPENIMIYTGSEYTVNLKVTLKAANNSSDADDAPNSKVEASLALYNKMGKMILLKKVTGIRINRLG